MKKVTYLSIALMLIFCTAKAQTTAMQLNGMDCNGNMHNLYQDLDAGKAVLLHFFMPNCGSCPPPAQKIQAMANKIMATHPGMITGYAMPFQNSTSCAYTASWVTNGGLSLYAPFDSGAAQVAYYGGFGMPTVVLLGGADHRVMFSTLSFSNSDTTIMRDSILALLSTTGINTIESKISSVNMYPNPAGDKMQIELNVIKSENIRIDIIDLLGKEVLKVYESTTATGILKRDVVTSHLNNGAYFIKVSAGSNYQNYKFTVVH